MYAIGKLLPFLTPRHRRTGLASVLVLIGYLLAAPALAQVAGLCGPGKVCQVRALRTGEYGPGQVCLKSTTYLMGLGNVGIENTIRFYTDNNCSVLASGGLRFQPSGNLITAELNFRGEGTVRANSGFDAPLAFASFPSATGITGRLLFDATNSRWRQARLNAWVPFLDAASETQTIHVPLNAALNNPLNQWSWTYGNAGLEQNTTVFIDSAVTLTAGVGAGNAVYKVYDATGAAATSATVTVPCTSAAGTVTSGGSDNTLRTLPRNLQLRLTTNGCSTLPVLNVVVRTSAL